MAIGANVYWQIPNAFSSLLQPIVKSIDRNGLRKSFLQKHLVRVDRFYELLSDLKLTNEAAQKLLHRLEKNRDKLFTFLNYDDVSWHNNNAEHAIKGFAKFRNVVGGRPTIDSIERYLILLSVCQTCKYQEIDFLEFLFSGEKDIDAYGEKRRRRFRKRQGNTVASESGSVTIPQSHSANVAFNLRGLYAPKNIGAETR